MITIDQLVHWMDNLPTPIIVPAFFFIWTIIESHYFDLLFASRGIHRLTTPSDEIDGRNGRPIKNALL
jgi:hypothetical protein